MALYLAEKLIREVDPDDDEEMGLLQSILYNALTSDEECHVLELMVKGGIDLGAPIHRGGSVECIRDSCLTGNAGVKAIRKLMEFINILNVTDMAGIHKVRPHAGVGPGVVLALIKS